MKKIVALISLLGLSFAVSACGDDGNKTRYCDSSFTEGCENGVYVSCEITSTDGKGRVVEKATVTFNGVEYVCDGDKRVPKGYSCKDGQLFDGTTGVSMEAKCGAEDKIMFCDGDEVVSGDVGCGSTGVLRCEGGEIQASKCADGKTCVAYEKSDVYTAGCFDSDKLTDGCADNTTTFGTCDAANNVLLFCTRKDASKGKTIRMDCAARNQSCMLIDKTWGYDCAATCFDDDKKPFTDFGECEGTLLHYCDTKKADDDETITESKYDLIDCTNNSKGKTSCGWDSVQNQYDCI